MLVGGSARFCCAQRFFPVFARLLRSSVSNIPVLSQALSLSPPLPIPKAPTPLDPRRERLLFSIGNECLNRGFKQNEENRVFFLNAWHRMDETNRVLSKPVQKRKRQTQREGNKTFALLRQSNSLEEIEKREGGRETQDRQTRD